MRKYAGSFDASNDALLHAVVDQVARQVGKDRLTAKAAGVRVDRKLPAQYAEVVRIVHDRADVRSVFIVLASDEPVPLERRFGVGALLSVRYVDSYPGDRVRQLLNRHVLVIAHSHLGHQPSNLLGPLTQRAGLR